METRSTTQQPQPLAWTPEKSKTGADKRVGTKAFVEMNFRYEISTDRSVRSLGVRVISSEGLFREER